MNLLLIKHHSHSWHSLCASLTVSTSRKPSPSSSGRCVLKAISHGLQTGPTQTRLTVVWMFHGSNSVITSVLLNLPVSCRKQLLPWPGNAFLTFPQAGSYQKATSWSMLICWCFEAGSLNDPDVAGTQLLNACGFWSLWSNEETKRRCCMFHAYRKWLS